jgi:hypothetical protein
MIAGLLVVMDACLLQGCCMFHGAFGYTGGEVHTHTESWKYNYVSQSIQRFPYSTFLSTFYVASEQVAHSNRSKLELSLGLVFRYLGTHLHYCQ